MAPRPSYCSPIVTAPKAYRNYQPTPRARYLHNNFLIAPTAITLLSLPIFAVIPHCNVTS